MQPSIKALLLLTLSVSVLGCGQMGGLYHPTEEAPAEPAEVAEDTTNEAAEAP